MSKLKSIEELEKIRQAAMERLELRATAEDEDRIIVRVGMATCGIASGARETMQAILEELKKQDITNVSVVQTGCLGYCAQEPIVEVICNDMPKVMYGHVDPERAREIVKEHIKKGHLIQNAIIGKLIEK